METNKIYQGHVLDILAIFPNESIDCIVTSPPYYGLRDYKTEPQIWDGDKNCEHDFEIKERYIHRGSADNTVHGAINKGGLEVDWKTKDGFCLKCNAWKGQLGLEPSLNLYIKHLLQITAELKRVLKKTGTLWWNHGDSYGGSGTGQKLEHRGKLTLGQMSSQTTEAMTKLRKESTYPEKSLILQAHRLAICMIDEQHWILRNTLIWWKPNCMPSSIKDRFTVDYEPIFFFTKSKKYYFEQQFEPLSESYLKENRPFGILRQRLYKNSKYVKGGYGNNQFKNKKNLTTKQKAYRESFVSGGGNIDSGGINNPNSRKKAIERMLKSNGRNMRSVWSINPQPFPEAHFAVFPEELVEIPIKAGCPKGGIVLDPFIGSGTTAVVAKGLGRNYIGVEINPKFVKMAEERLKITKEQFRMIAEIKKIGETNKKLLEYG